MAPRLRSLGEEIAKFLQIAKLDNLPEEVRLVLAFSAAEIASAMIIASSGEKKLRAALCKMKSSRRINRALAILKREGVLDQERYERLRRCLRALRCLRNSYLHPICVEKCPRLTIEEAIACVEELAALAMEFARSRGWDLSCR